MPTPHFVFAVWLPIHQRVQVAVALASMALALPRSHRPGITHKERAGGGLHGVAAGMLSEGENNMLQDSNPVGKAANAKSNLSQHVGF